MIEDNYEMRHLDGQIHFKPSRCYLKIIFLITCQCQHLQKHWFSNFPVPPPCLSPASTFNSIPLICSLVAGKREDQRNRCVAFKCLKSCQVEGRGEHLINASDFCQARWWAVKIYYLVWVPQQPRWLGLWISFKQSGSQGYEGLWTAQLIK